MPFFSTEYEVSRSARDYLDTQDLAGACNIDCRFQEAGWVETPASVEYALLDSVFHEGLTKLMASGTKPALGVMVASLYGWRVRQRGALKKAIAAKPGGRGAIS